jgi:DeoR/GlpR family transcriptional regulator of sugar metabolism
VLILTVERRATIAELVAQRGAVRATELANRFDVDVSTIRRDLQTLEEQPSILAPLPRHRKRASARLSPG